MISFRLVWLVTMNDRLASMIVKVGESSSWGCGAVSNKDHNCSWNRVMGKASSPVPPVPLSVAIQPAQDLPIGISYIVHMARHPYTLSQQRERQFHVQRGGRRRSGIVGGSSDDGRTEIYPGAR